MPPHLGFYSPILLFLIALTVSGQTFNLTAITALEHAEPDPKEPSWNSILRRDASARQRLPLEQPTVVRKMTHDEGEKFWMHYWYSSEDDNIRPEPDAYGIGPSDNTSSLLPAYPRHFEPLPLEISLFGHELWVPRNLQHKKLFRKRDFQCPSNTRPCTSISRPNSCCPAGTTCQLIPDTGLGDVGCCPGDNSKCAGELKNCPNGYMNCSDFPGGGCCIPGYTCVKDGCLFISTQTVTVTPTRISSSLSPSTTIVSSTTQTTSTQSVSPPIRPTSNPTTTTTTTISPSSSLTVPSDFCPTGFYACNAYYIGGCCQIGRDCNTTSCPPLTPYTTINSNGVTVVIPASATFPPQPTRKCANGWTSCSSQDGGGCCPNGFRCGLERCTFSGTGGPGPTGEAVVGKISPENSARRLPTAELAHFWPVLGVLGAVLWV